MSQSTRKYLVPVEITCKQPYKWLDYTVYEYKLYSDSSESDFTSIKFVESNGYIIGEHMPTKLNTVYDRAAAQVKNTTVKAVNDIKNVVNDVTDIAVTAAAEVKQDVASTAKQTVNIATTFFGKVKQLTKTKFSKKEND